MQYPRHNRIGQRQHTNPRTRLKLWEAPDLGGHIWCYRKQSGRGSRIYRQTIASATVVRSVWTEEAEARLNNEVEQPAAAGLAQLADTLEPQLASSERKAVAGYLVSLFRRGWQELAAQPQRVEPEVRRLAGMIDAASDLSMRTRQEIKAALEEQSKCPPIAPLPIEEVGDVLAAMRWTVLRSANPSFATGDSPVQIVPDVVVDRECEISLPLTPTRALVCDWGIPQPWTVARTATAAEILGVNRRTALGADSFIYFARRPSDNDVETLLERRPRRRILGDVDGRRVPRRHRQTMELGARRIFLGRPSENMAVIEQLRVLEAQSQMALDDGDRT